MDPEVGELFRPYVWGQSGFFNLFEPLFEGRTYAQKGLSTCSTLKVGYLVGSRIVFH
jgi:hypothetical protein